MKMIDIDNQLDKDKYQEEDKQATLNQHKIHDIDKEDENISEQTNIYPVVKTNILFKLKECEEWRKG